MELTGPCTLSSTLNKFRSLDFQSESINLSESASACTSGL